MTVDWVGVLIMLVLIGLMVRAFVKGHKQGKGRGR